MLERAAGLDSLSRLRRDLLATLLRNLRVEHQDELVFPLADSRRRATIAEHSGPPRAVPKANLAARGGHGRNPRGCTARWAADRESAGRTSPGSPPARSAALSLLIGLPGLLRRPEPPPLEPDIGLAPASSTPTRVAAAPGMTARAGAQGAAPRLTAARTARRPRSSHAPEPAAPPSPAGGRSRRTRPRAGGACAALRRLRLRPSPAYAAATAARPVPRPAVPRRRSRQRTAARRPTRIRLRALSDPDRKGTKHRCPRPTSTRARALLAVAIVACPALAAPASARAGAYRAALCNPDLGARHADATFERNSRHYLSDASCERRAATGSPSGTTPRRSRAGAWGAWVMRVPERDRDLEAQRQGGGPSRVAAASRSSWAVRRAA